MEDILRKPGNLDQDLHVDDIGNLDQDLHVEDILRDGNLDQDLHVEDILRMEPGSGPPCGGYP